MQSIRTVLHSRQQVLDERIILVAFTFCAIVIVGYIKIYFRELRYCEQKFLFLQ